MPNWPGRTAMTPPLTPLFRGEPMRIQSIRRSSGTSSQLYMHARNVLTSAACSAPFAAQRGDDTSFASAAAVAARSSRARRDEHCLRYEIEIFSSTCPSIMSALQLGGRGAVAVGPVFKFRRSTSWSIAEQRWAGR